MDKHKQGYTRSPSTKWEWRKVRVAAGPAPAGDRAAVGGSAQPRRRRDAHAPITVQVLYRGGASCSYLVSYRGTCIRFDGFECIHDVMRVINGETKPWER